jgi:hypothetical protein
VNKTLADIKPDWRWGTPEGSREFDRLIDRGMSFRETVEWLEEAESLALRMAVAMKRPLPGEKVGQRD